MTLMLGLLPSSSLACELIQYHWASGMLNKTHQRIRSEDFVDELACCALEPSVALWHTTHVRLAVQTFIANHELTSV